jgi:uncharacterized protein (DUF433 family)
MDDGHGIYILADFSRLLRQPRETVREWTVKGLAPSRKRGQRISPSIYRFQDLISLYVVSELRKRGIPLPRIRKAEEWLRHEAGIERPFATTHLYTADQHIFVLLAEESGRENLASNYDSSHLIAASGYGQEAIREAFGSVLNSVRYEDGIARYWEPWQDVEINPRRQFGAPCVAGTGIQTATLYSFIRAGDDPHEVAGLYDLPLERVNHAVSWEESLVSSN